MTFEPTSIKLSDDPCRQRSVPDKSFRDFCFNPADLCKLCGFRWNGSLEAILSASTKFASLFFDYTRQPLSAKWDRANLSNGSVHCIGIGMKELMNSDGSQLSAPVGQLQGGVWAKSRDFALLPPILKPHHTAFFGGWITQADVPYLSLLLPKTDS